MIKKTIQRPRASILLNGANVDVNTSQIRAVIAEWEGVDPNRVFVRFNDTSFRAHVSIKCADAPESDRLPPPPAVSEELKQLLAARATPPPVVDPDTLWWKHYRAVLTGLCANSFNNNRTVKGDEDVAAGSADRVHGKRP